MPKPVQNLHVQLCKCNNNNYESASNCIKCNNQIKKDIESLLKKGDMLKHNRRGK